MKSIQSRITATHLSLAVLLVAGISTISIIEITRYFETQLVTDMSKQADLISLFLRSKPTHSFEEIDKQVRLISGVESMRVTLIDERGNVVADSDVPSHQLPTVENHLQRPEVQQALQQGTGIDKRHSATVGRDFLYVAKQIKQAGTTGPFRDVSIIRLSMPLEDVQSRARDIRWTIVSTGVFVLLLVAGISLIISRRITRPMIQIADGVERIRAGNLDEHLPVTSKDEISRVAQAVNEMVLKLKSDIIQLKKLEDVRSEFLANVSHELRTPIFAIQGFLETLLNGAVDDPAVNRSFLERAQSNATRLNALLADLINISQIESGEMRMSFRYFPINDFLTGVADDFQQSAQQRTVALHLKLEPESSTEIYGDRERLRQVLNNLIENALRYNKPGGVVTLSSRSTVHTVCIEIVDTGIGIPPDHLNRVFERFYRVDKDRSREVGGTGLGLAIVKHIIEAHGSKVQVESTLGVGTRFWFELKKG